MSGTPSLGAYCYCTNKANAYRGINLDALSYYPYNDVNGMEEKSLKGLSLFSGAGIGETYLNECNIDICVANELIPRRAELYRKIYPSSNMICGDIMDDDVFDSILNAAKDIDFLIASPPCQGMSIAGKNRNQKDMSTDGRNYLIERVFQAISILKPSFVIIENVPSLLKFKLPFNGNELTVLEILQELFGEEYIIEGKVLNSADYGVPQVRLRAIIKLHKRGLTWDWPKTDAHHITVREAIGDLPSLEAGEKSNIKWHFARKHSPSHIAWMAHTPTGCTAFDNEKYFPQKEDGTRIKGYGSSYRRIKWDEPCPTITIRNDAISSQRNVHPGRLLKDGTYSDARVLTPYELMVLNSLPVDWNIPDDTPEILIRQVIGESIPPLLIKRLAEGIHE